MWTKCPYTHCCQWLIRIWLSCHKVMSSVLLVALGYLRHRHRIGRDDPWPLPFWISSRTQGRIPHSSKIIPDANMRELNLASTQWGPSLFPLVRKEPTFILQVLQSTLYGQMHVTWVLQGSSKASTTGSRNTGQCPCKAWHKCHNFPDCKNRRDQGDLYLSFATVILVRSQKSILQPPLFSCVFSI